MHTFKLTILGSNSALPAYNRFPTSQVLNVSEKLYLIDCGEGTQINLSKYEIKRSKIQNIFISHLHGDHYFGLVGLLTSYALMGRKTPLTIFCPEGLQEIIDIQVNASAGHLGYPINFETIDPFVHQLIYENDDVTVHSLPADHGMPCCGFLFTEKPHQKKILKEKITEYNIGYEEIREIKTGANFTTTSGTIIPNEELTTPAPKSRSYAYSADTAYNEQLPQWISGVDLLYHEATFLAESEAIAADKKHSTTTQAANIAKLAKVNKLLIGHFSARYKVLDAFLEESKTVFENTELAIEGESFSV
ncbi:UNVERIFIED_CONTAM: hypothetical protein GTU68_022403 [Idotea baltica]|nr:hypothetical protein [Idotea baltica]